MKKDIHPEYREVVFQDVQSDFKFLTRSTMSSDEKIKWEDGKEYPLIKVEVSSASHPFYTGKKIFVDTAGRVEKFNQKYKAMQALKQQEVKKEAPKEEAKEEAPAAEAPKKEVKEEAEKIYKNSFPRIITVSRLDKRKGHDKILMLIKNLKPKFPNIKYLYIGFGKEEKNLIKLTKELSLDKDVIFLKNINENLKLALIESSNLFLMPSRIEGKSIEGFGISFVEAASYGVGSIGGKDGGASDAILHNKTGLICDGNDLNSIYESVIYFFEKNKFSEFGKAAKVI